MARKISKHEADFDTTAFMAVRHGQQNDITATYDLQVLDNPELTVKLMEMRAAEVNQVIIDEAVQSALAVMRQ